jgi:hypothetical protein
MEMNAKLYDSYPELKAYNDAVDAAFDAKDDYTGVESADKLNADVIRALSARAKWKYGSGYSTSLEEFSFDEVGAITSRVIKGAW